MERQKAPRTNRSRKTLPAAFYNPGEQRVRSPTPHGERDVGGNAGAASSAAFATAANATLAPADVLPYEGPVGDGAVGIRVDGAVGADRSGFPVQPAPIQDGWDAFNDRGRGEIRPDSLVFLSSCPQRHGHAVLKKMLHPPTLRLFCLVELPGADQQRALLRASLQDWLRRWCTVQTERPFLLVAVCETFWDAPQGYPMGILCDYMPLGSLDELLQACGGLPEESMREIAQAVLEALHELHSVQPPVVHGCLKPSQILFDTKGRPRLAFGLEQRLRACQNARRDASSGAIPRESDGVGANAADPSGAMGGVASTEQHSTAVDIFDMGLLLLVSALGGKDVLVDAIPYAREFGSRSVQGPSAPLSAVFHDTCSLLRRELRVPAASAAKGVEVGVEEGDGSASDMGYLPPAADLLFNRRYSESFLAFVSTCLEAHTREAPVNAGQLLQHDFLQLSSPLASPLVSLREMHELARMLNEAPEHDPSRFGPVKSSRSSVPGVAPSVAQSAQLYLANIAQSIAPHFGSRATHGGVAFSGPPRRRQAEWETLLVDSARTLGLPRSVVQAALEAQLDGLLSGGGSALPAAAGPAAVDPTAPFASVAVAATCLPAAA
eukprot:TRINITY_DN45614_c0_g1_i1.p1 TRINITY_DN45614_c0_g1~~TRINITY_DN45614_c0_g1_i1.p1  ORF type:complete len:608 (-),score=104.45 TRINITY_DN45614_c0_g1_i1:68-1891(-)